MCEKTKKILINRTINNTPITVFLKHLISSYFFFSLVSKNNIPVIFINKRKKNKNTKQIYTKILKKQKHNLKL